MKEDWQTETTVQTTRILDPNPIRRPIRPIILKPNCYLVVIHKIERRTLKNTGKKPIHVFVHESNGRVDMTSICPDGESTAQLTEEFE